MGKFRNRMRLTLIAWTILALAGNSYAANNRIEVDCTKTEGEVQQHIFGSNLLAHDPALSCTESWAKNHSGYREYGAGVWDPGRMEPVPAALKLGQEAGITLLRFPGGCGSHGYNWKKAIGKGRNRYKFGLCEFCKLCQALHADAVITLSYFNDTPQDGADLVAFLNRPSVAVTGQRKDRADPSDWPRKRAENGCPQPLRVKYFEIGNEVWHGDHLRIKTVKPEEYARRYLLYYDAMKAVDPSAQIGVVLDTEAWNQKVLAIVKDKVDFGILHTYPAPGYGRELEALTKDKLFSMCLGMPVAITEPHYQKTLRLMKECAHRDIPLAITEYNGGFFLRSSIPYQFTLGNALINAELLRVFSKPENNILMANQWNYANEHWGMISNGFDQDASRLETPFVKRPVFFVFELYRQHFGKYLLPVTVDSETYCERGYTVGYITVNASTNRDRSKVFLMALNKNLQRPMDVEIVLRGGKSPARVEAWVLNGPDYLATNEKDPATVGIRKAGWELALNGATLKATLEPHSLTAIEIGQ